MRNKVISEATGLPLFLVQAAHVALLTSLLIPLLLKVVGTSLQGGSTLYHEQEEKLCSKLSIRDKEVIGCHYQGYMYHSWISMFGNQLKFYLSRVLLSLSHPIVLVFTICKDAVWMNQHQVTRAKTDYVVMRLVRNERNRTIATLFDESRAEVQEACAFLDLDTEEEARFVTNLEMTPYTKMFDKWDKYVVDVGFTKITLILIALGGAFELKRISHFMRVLKRLRKSKWTPQTDGPYPRDKALQRRSFLTSF